MRKVLLTVSVLLLVSGAACLIAAEGHNPENAAEDSEVVVHGIVSNIAGSGEVAKHHPVKINVTEVFKGNTSDTVTIQIQGTDRMSVSTAAQFTEGEEVVVMLEEQEDCYYMTNGYATKYEVSENDTIQLVAPERKNITVAEMESIVEQTSNSNSTSPEVQQREGTESSFDIIAVLEAALNWVF
ncbi:hypothetical protein [Candidatus Nanohalobium constans]|uniref:Uncharacterized protein n=1 Tax=Candidatus Nanohalobium constans TaxID=2565781 RepID=A0A5Q0UGZ8_9ARCH|nr:hypothetical protein [Candidatus Nanohalobium constans]QGA80856.1 hypothetical protein LC1Nh_0976 [Candidatus Nanohalobium constans]